MVYFWIFSYTGPNIGLESCFLISLLHVNHIPHEGLMAGKLTIITMLHTVGEVINMVAI